MDNLSAAAAPASSSDTCADNDVPTGTDDLVLRLRLQSKYQKDILELAAQNGPIADSLNGLVRAAQSLRGPDTRAAVFIFDPQAAKLKFAAATGLSPEYTSAIDGFPVGPAQPSCGKAAYVGDDVIVRDVAHDTAWAPYRQLAEAQGIRACWSFLLRGPNGQTLGTFALYHGVPCEPDAEDYAEIGYFARIASLLIERHVAAAAQASEQQDQRQSAEKNDHFLAVLAHELRNPLAALRSALSVNQLAQAQPQSRERALEVMERQITRMEWLIEDLVDANRVARGQLRLELARIALNPVLDLALETVMPQFRQKQQTVFVSIPLDSGTIEADAGRVTQMLTNLLGNACKFTPVLGHVSLSVVVEAANVAVHVRDNGIGLAPEERERIFDLFVQGEKHVSGRLGGLGIGLALVKELAALHGGSVSVRSDGLGKGSEFILRLPRAPA